MRKNLSRLPKRKSEEKEDSYRKISGIESKKFSRRGKEDVIDKTSVSKFDEVEETSKKDFTGVYSFKINDDEGTDASLIEPKNFSFDDDENGGAKTDDDEPSVPAVTTKPKELLFSSCVDHGLTDTTQINKELLPTSQVPQQLLEVVRQSKNVNVKITNVKNITHEHAIVKIGGPSLEKVDLKYAKFGLGESSHELELSNQEMEKTIEKVHGEIRKMKDILITFSDLDSPAIEEYPSLYVIKSLSDGYGVKREYKPDDNFNTKISTIKGEKIEFHEIIATEKSKRHTMLCGGAGQGKSTLLRRYSKKFVIGEVKLPDVQLVIFLELKLLNYGTKTHLSNVLFRQFVELNISDKQSLLKWAKVNSKKVLIVLDGIDQIPTDLNNCIGGTNYDEKDLPENFIRDILQGRLFPESLLLTSSREHAVVGLHQGLQPDVFISLGGLQSDAIDRLVLEMAGKDGKKILDNLKLKNLVLYTVCNIPIFLIYVTAVYKRNIDDPPHTITGIMLNIIFNFVQSKEHARTTNVFEVRQKLMKMAFFGTLQGRVTFRFKDLEEYGLAKKEINDLIIVVSEKSVLLDFMEGDAVLFYSHQILQETMAAVYICQMPFQQFAQFVSANLHKDHWKVVRNIVLGTIMDPRLETLHGNIKDLAIKNIKEKRKILTDHLHKISFLVGILDLMRLLFECGQGAKFILQDKTERVVLERHLSVYDVYCIGSVLSHKDKVVKLKLCDCKITGEHVNVLSHALERKGYHPHVQSQVQIESMDLFYNHGIECDQLWRIVVGCQVKHLHLALCDITSLGIEDFAEEIKKNENVYPVQIETLDLSGNTGIECNVLWKIIVECQVKHLYLFGCDITSSGSEDFAVEILKHENVNPVQIETLGLSYNHGIECEKLWRIVVGCQVKHLHLNSCGITSSGIGDFAEEISKHENVNPVQIETLHLSYNYGIDCDQLWKIIAGCQVKHLNLCGCGITSFGIKKLAEEILKHENVNPVQIETLGLSYNHGRECEKLWRIVVGCQVKHLHLNSCGITSSAIEDFAEELSKHENVNPVQIETLGLGNNYGIECDQLWKTVVGCKVKRLYLDKCNLTSSEMKKFAEGIAKTKHTFNHLDLSSNEIKYDMKTALTTLMSHVEGEILLSVCDDDLHLELKEASKLYPNMKLNFEQNDFAIQNFLS